MSHLIEIEIISDFACPWCLIGKRRLQEAVESRPDLDFEIKWTPYQLNPTMPREGKNRREYYQNKFGESGTKNLRTMLSDAGADSGINFCDKPEAMAPNTLSAHLLMEIAEQNESIDMDVLSEKLFIAHHVDCENIGDIQVLLRIAQESGMQATDIREKLSSLEDESRVSEIIQQSQKRGISGVPTFIFNNKYAVSGAQTAENLSQTFDQILNSDQ